MFVHNFTFMKQILCAIDFSESSGKVLEVAAGIASAYQAHLIVLFPYRLIHNGYRGDIPSLKVKLETEAREKFQNLRKNLAGYDQLSCEFAAEIGFMADRIAAHVSKKDIELVIIGQHLNAATNDPKGFNLQELIAHSGLPFVIVPSQVSAEAVGAWPNPSPSI